MTCTDSHAEPKHDDGPLSAWDAASLIIGIVVGASIFVFPATVMRNTGGWLFFVLWIVGALLSLAGALCYCELATAYPRLGGDYEYLSRAWGRWMGFLFGWMRLTVILPANVGVMAFVFAEHAGYLHSLSATGEILLASGVVIVLTMTNLCGVMFGKTVQNVLTIAKVFGLAAIILAGVFAAFDTTAVPASPAASSGIASVPSIGLALVFVLYTYGGWSDAAFVAAEVRNRRRNIPRALLLGLGSIAALYLVVNVAYVSGLGEDRFAASDTPAADLLGQAFGRAGGSTMSVIVMLSTLGAVNAMIFTAARVFAVMGEDHRPFAALGAWDRVRGTPSRAFLAIAAISLVLIWLTGSESGRGMLSWPLQLLGGSDASLASGKNAAEMLVTGSSAVFWLFFLLTGVSVIWLRVIDRDTERPFRVPLFPVTPLIFCATCAYMLWSSVTYAGELSLIGLGLLVVGLGLYLVSRLPRSEQREI